MIVEFKHGDCFTTVLVEVGGDGESTFALVKEHFCRKCRHQYSESELLEIRLAALDAAEDLG